MNPSVPPSCHAALLPFCHSAILPFCHSAILPVLYPFCLFAFLPFCLFAFLPFCLFAFLPFCLSAFLPYRYRLAPREQLTHGGAIEELEAEVDEGLFLGGGIRLHPVNFERCLIYGRPKGGEIQKIESKKSKIQIWIQYRYGKYGPKVRKI